MTNLRFSFNFFSSGGRSFGYVLVNVFFLTASIEFQNIFIGRYT